jgi:hypothetical protein
LLPDAKTAAFPSSNNAWPILDIGALAFLGSSGRARASENVETHLAEPKSIQ